jgi:hypothetical protein
MVDIQKLNELYKTWINCNPFNKEECDTACKNMGKINEFFKNGYITLDKEKTVGNIIIGGSQIFNAEKPISEIVEYAKKHNINTNIAYSWGKYIEI